ncbi:hypothetical protein DYBT9275_04652 [Dyadobacter sp. CECT 9275]|uniref:Uncharacterized protein n=1 Tax=Dyadobacter helix TaxID=2822344 RepID=A0A916JEU0_9BACT|nr:hypothetical protein DYBT9275_04652 [Dyadobacter sp. CECT 9275]
MKIICFLCFAVFLFSCTKRNVLHTESILSVHPVFQDTSHNHWQGYRVKKELIPYDVNNGYVKEYLSRNLNNINSFKEEENLSRIADKIKNSKTNKYFPIKVIPLNEFGYVRLTNNKTILYGLMGNSAFIDLTNNKVYMR